MIGHKDVLLDLLQIKLQVLQGWSGDAIVLGKLPVSGRPTNIDYSRARAYCICNRCGRGGFDILLSSLFGCFWA